MLIVKPEILRFYVAGMENFVFSKMNLNLIFFLDKDIILYIIFQLINN